MRQTLAFCLALPLLAAATPAHAQLTDADKAVLAFDVYLDRLTGSDLAASTGMEDPTKAMPAGSQSDIDMKEVRRVYGAISAPADMGAIESRSGTDPLPMNFFVRLQFNSPEAAEKNLQNLSEEGRKETINGKEYLRPPDDGDTPSNMLVHLVSPDMMELGTDGFVLHSSRHVFSDNLLAAWKKMPVASIRVAADLDGARHLIDQGLQAAQAGGAVPPPAMTAVNMVNDIAGVRFALDFSSENMLWLTLSGKDATGTGTIKNTIDGFLMMGKGAAQQMLPGIPSEKLKGVATELVDALATTQDGNDVNLVLPRPDGFEEAIAEAVPMAMQAMMGGMGGPGGFGPGGPGPGGDPFGAPPGDGDADPFGAPAAETEPDPFGADPFGN